MDPLVKTASPKKRVLSHVLRSPSKIANFKLAIDSIERFKGSQFPKCIVLQVVFYYLRFSLSYRDIEEIMKERNVPVDHATIQRWVIKYSPGLEREYRKKKPPVGSNWFTDETYVKVKGQWCNLYRAVDKTGQTIEFLFRKNRDEAAAKAFFDKALGAADAKKITIDKSGSNTAALNDINKTRIDQIEIRQSKNINNWLSRIIDLSNESSDQCLGLKHLIQRWQP